MPQRSGRLEKKIEIMIDIQNTHDGFADFNATQKEWDGLKAIVAHANTRFDSTELNLDMDAKELAGLHKELQTHHDLPAPLEQEHLRALLQTVSRTDTMIVPGMSSNEHWELVRQLEDINVLDIFGGRGI